ncbi:Hypothetical protein, putative [Bodo saltans]|nr:Hypothetical protein, putative [Bodo saltans]|eukprot:CUG06538.1 Hypothetical protein, putative [Bodo saltans]
MLIHDLHPKSF